MPSKRLFTFSARSVPDSRYLFAIYNETASSRPARCPSDLKRQDEQGQLTGWTPDQTNTFLRYSRLLVAIVSGPSSKLKTSTETKPEYPTSFSAAAIGLKSTSPKPGPFRFLSLAWKCAKCGQDSRMICGIGLVSEHMAFTSIMILKRGELNGLTNSIASAAVLTKLVSDGASGSKQIVTPRSSARLTGSRNVAAVQSHAC